MDTPSARPESCPKVHACPLFPVFGQNAALSMLKALYCEGVYESCKRLESVQGGVIPARDLLPDGRRLPRRKKLATEWGSE